MNYPDTFDVIVVGGGHAGTEASLASAEARDASVPAWPPPTTMTSKVSG